MEIDETNVEKSIPAGAVTTKVKKDEAAAEAKGKDAAEGKKDAKGKTKGKKDKADTPAKPNAK